MAQRGPGRLQANPTSFQDPGGPACAVAQQAQHDVLRAHVAMAQAVSLVPGQVQDLADMLAAPHHLLSLRNRNRPPAYL
jgi:hypothetical protein